MKKLFDFKCPEGHVTEHLVYAETTVVRCDCGEEANRIISPVRSHLNGADDSFPGAHMKWVREHEKAGSKKPAP